MRRLLVIKPSSLGDVVHGLQALAVLRAGQPDWHVTWVAKIAYVELIRSSGLVDALIPYNRERGAAGLAATALAVRRWKGDCVWDLQGLARSVIWTRAARAPQRMGRSDAREMAGWAYTEKVPVPAGGNRAHALEILLEFPRRMGVRELAVPPLRFRAERMEAELERYMAENRRAVLVFPESRRPEKSWPGFEELVGRMVGAGIPVAVLGCERGRAWGLPGVYDGRGRHRIEEICHLFGPERTVIANDSGPLHLAAATGARTIGLFGPTDPGRYGPWGGSDGQHRVLRAKDHRMESISVEAVMGALGGWFPPPILRGAMEG